MMRPQTKLTVRLEEDALHFKFFNGDLQRHCQDFLKPDGGVNLTRRFEQGLHTCELLLQNQDIIR